MAKPTNDPTLEGTWAPTEAAAPGSVLVELVVTSGMHIDKADNEGPLIQSRREQQTARLPYPEAMWWSRFGSRGFRSGTTVQPTLWFEGGFMILADDGVSAIQLA